jgi:hypothetical protein
MHSSPLTVAQEAEAQRLVGQIQEVAQEELLALARLLVSKPEAEIFGDTEFQARDLVHRIAAKAFTLHLREKKKKRLPRLQHRLQALRASRRLPGLPAEEAAEPGRGNWLPPCLLLLPSVRGLVSVG